MKNIFTLPSLFLLALVYSTPSWGMSWLASRLVPSKERDLRFKTSQAKPAQDPNVPHKVAHEEYEQDITKSVFSYPDGTTEIVLAKDVDTTDQATHGIRYGTEIGFAALEEENRLCGLGVKEKYCSLGYATKLFNEARKACHENDKYMYGFAIPFDPYGDNKKALTQEQLIKFYEKRGAIFKPCSTLFIVPIPKQS